MKVAPLLAVTTRTTRRTIRRVNLRMTRSLIGSYKRMVAKIGYKTQPAYYSDLIRQASHWSRNPEELCSHLNLDVTDSFSSEFNRFARTMREKAQRSWPEYFDLGSESGLFLYLIIRATKPKIVVETGVANGISSAIILTAMDANGLGELHSVDMTRDVGHAFGQKHPRWRLHVTHGRVKDLERVLKEIGDLDIFFHDADHSYWAQTGEFKLAKKYLKHGGILVSDDIDSSWAFRDFCNEHNLRMNILQDKSKLFGFAHLDDA